MSEQKEYAYRLIDARGHIVCHAPAPLETVTNMIKGKGGDVTECVVVRDKPDGEWRLPYVGELA